MKKCCFISNSELTEKQADFLKVQIVAATWDLMRIGYMGFIVSLSSQSSMLSANVITQFKAVNNRIFIEATMLHKNDEEPPSIKIEDILVRCDSFKIIEEEPNKNSFEKQNEYMVDEADLVAAIWDGKKSGHTYNAINYAKSKGKRVINLYI